MSDPLAAVYEAIERTLRQPDNEWQGRVYPDRAPAQKLRPYAVFNVGGDVDLSQIKQADPLIVVTVRCVAETRQSAFNGRSQIAVLLDDKGEQESADGAVVGNDDWMIATISLSRGLWIPERLRETTTIYHAGNDYEFVLKKR